MKTIRIGLAMFAALAASASAAPRFIVSTPSLSPESEIDFVLDSPAVAPAHLGNEVENTWFDAKPPLPGKLVWKAQNIASFLPDQPPAIGTTYTFSIRENLTHLDGTPVPAGNFATLASEPFRIDSASIRDRWSSGYSHSTSSWLLVFNDAVDPATAAAFVSYASKSGQSVTARLEHATVETAGYYGNRQPWAERGKPSTPKAADEIANHVLIASPLTPLPVGEEWTLSVRAGLPNQSATAKLGVGGNYVIGDVDPFQATSIDEYVEVDEPRKIIITFNHPLPEELPDDFLLTSLSLSPFPADLTAEAHGHQIHLLGSFAGADNYSVEILPPLLSRHGLTLEKELQKNIVFQRLDPELVLPSEDEAQLAHGSRAYRLLTINLSSVRVRIKQLSGPNLIRTLQGYEHYTGRGHDGTDVSPTAPVPYSLVPGKTLLDREFPLDNPIDTSRELTLLWDELLPENLRNAALFLDITGTPHPDAAASGRRNSQALLQLTDLGLAWKLTPSEALLYAFSCDTGAPLPGVKIDVFGEDAAVLHTVRTDASGIATLPRTAGARHFLASLGTDSYATSFDNTLSTVGMWHFPIRYSWEPPVESLRRAFLFTDRSLYRPGETVRLKGIVRTQRGNLVEAADGAGSPRLVILDPTEKEIHTSEVTLSENGSFDLTYRLPAGITGHHTIRLEYSAELEQAETSEDWQEHSRLLRSAVFEIPLRVEEFRRNAFELNQTIQPPAIAAATISADLSATYYQGQPVAAGGVRHFSHVATKNPYPERFRDFLFGDHRTDDWAYWYHYFGYRSDEDSHNDSSVRAHGKTTLAPDGTATIEVEIPRSDFPVAREVTLSTEVTDANNQTLTASSTATIHPASAYIGISRIDRLVRANDTVPFKIVATDTDGNPFPGELKLTATLTRQVNSSVKTLGENGATATRNDVSEETVSTSNITLAPAASQKEGTLLPITPKETGLHFLTLRGTDPEGRSFATVTRFHVYGTRGFPWQYEDGLRVKLVSEKKSHLPGETARILVLTPIEGTALVTVEREKVLRSFLVELKADQPVIEVPLSEDDAPNAYVSVLIVKGARESAREYKEPQLRLGYCEITVENLRDKLAVTLDPSSAASGTIPIAHHGDKPAPATFRPGDEVTIKGRVTLADGTPAAGAEVTLYAEDEGTLAVMGYRTPDPSAHFHNPRFLDVNTGTSFHTFISENPEMQSFFNKGFFIGGGGDLSALVDLLRKNFDPCATWAPSLVTDKAGNFTHTFTVPDTLTRYRLIAIAHHGASRFGNVESAIVVNKPLMLEPKAPRFANQADTFSPQVLVQNASPYSGTWEISYDTADGQGTPVCRPLAGTTETITLAPGESTTLTFPTTAETTGEAVLTWSAVPVSLADTPLTDNLARALSDAVETRFPVHFPMPLLRQAKFIRLDQPGVPRNLLDSIDPNLLEGTGQIDLEFARSPLADAAGSVDFLLTYPYGCLEQTTSSLIPWLAAADLRSILPAFADIPPTKVQAAIQAGADRLLSMQLPNGSFSYWPGNTESADWASPYAGMGLLLAAENGAAVPDSAISSLVNHLAQTLRGISETTSPHALETHCHSLLVLSLAGAPQESYHNLLLDRLADLTPSARALLATAIAHGADGEETRLAGARALMTSTVPFRLKDDSWMPHSPLAAHQLIAWIAIDADSDEAARGLDRMLKERNPYGHWHTTWGNGWSLLAMAEYAKHEGESSKTISINLETAEGTETITLDPGNPFASRNLEITPSLALSLTTDETAFVRLKVAAKPKIAPLLPVAHNGLTIDRIHEKILPDGSAEILTDPRVGDLIRVTLRVTLPADGTRYLIVEDLLPSIFETVNTSFSSQTSAQTIRTSENDWRVSHSELRDDRALFFLDHIPQRGTYTLTYLARCTLDGQAVAPPAKVESMYDPSNVALSASRAFTTR